MVTVKSFRQSSGTINCFQFDSCMTFHIAITPRTTATSCNKVTIILLGRLSHEKIRDSNYSCYNFIRQTESRKNKR